MITVRLPQQEEKRLDEIIKKYENRQGKVLGIMEEAQKTNRFNYLSEDVLNYISMKIKVPLNNLYSVATFYSFFNLKPQGDHTIVVCRGTACHTKGSKALLDDLGVMMGSKADLDSGEPTFTTPDNKFTVRTVACFGQCAQAPVVSIDNVIHSNVTTTQMRKLVSKISKGRK